MGWDKIFLSGNKKSCLFIKNSKKKKKTRLLPIKRSCVGHQGSIDPMYVAVFYDSI